MAKRVLPYTPILQRYHDLPGPRAERLDAATHTDAADVAADLTASFDRLCATYSNVGEPFVPAGTRPDLAAPEEGKVRTTNALVARLQRQATWKVEGRPDLTFRYVEREVSLLRTKNAEFDGPEQAAHSAGRVLLADLLLADLSGAPIIGEIKVTHEQQTDKDPYSALIQALAGAVHIAIPSQRERLVRHCQSSRLNRLDGPVGVYVITSSYDQKQTYMRELLREAIRLADDLGQLEVPWLGPIAFLDATQGPSGGLVLRPLAVS